MYIHVIYIYMYISLPLNHPNKKSEQPRWEEVTTYRTVGCDEVRERMNGLWDEGRLLVSCYLAERRFTPPETNIAPENDGFQ